MADLIKKQDSRRTFVDTLNELAEKDDRIVVIIPDVGFNYLDDPKNKFKVINMGVTEQSAMIIAAAMALDGWKVFYYSMINFSVFRPYEMVRNAVCMHKAPVKIIGVKGSEKYKFLGFSHNLLNEYEDVEVLKHLPIDIYLPETNEQVREVILRSYKSERPSYVRL